MNISKHLDDKIKLFLNIRCKISLVLLYHSILSRSRSDFFVCASCVVDDFSFFPTSTSSW